LLLALAIVLLLWLVRTVLVRIIHRRFKSDPTVFYRWRKTLDYVLAVICIFLIGRIWIEGVQSLATYLGLLSAGLAIALQDLIVSLAGWLFIIWRRPFVVGDRVQIGDEQSREILSAEGIRLPKSKLCANVDEATAFADELGYPVVMKIASPDILHKTDVGGVRVGLQSPTDVRDAFDLMVYRAHKYQPDARLWGCLVQEQMRGGKEIILGMNRDPQFGPLVMFGLGGIYVEVLKDVAFRVAPFDRKEAIAMMHEIRGFGLLRGVRGEPPADLEAVADTLLRLSQLVTDFPEIVEMDINPLVVFEKGRGVVGVDMRLILKS
jgi:hypothetical protein